MISRAKAEWSEAGFTLIEMLVVLAIVGLLLVVGRIAYRPNVDVIAALGSARTLASAFREAHETAVARDAAVGIRLDPTKMTIEGINMAGSWQLSPKVHIAAVETEAAFSDNKFVDFIFFPDGSSGGGKVTLEAQGARHEISINRLTGLAYVSP
jgi:general secretion pathway protein H